MVVARVDKKTRKKNEECQKCLENMKEKYNKLKYNIPSIIESLSQSLGYAQLSDQASATQSLPMVIIYLIIFKFSNLFQNIYDINKLFLAFFLFNCILTM